MRLRRFSPTPPLSIVLLCLITADAGAASPAVDPSSIPDSEYVVVRDGHLSVDGVRQRYWAVTGKVYSLPRLRPDDPPEVRARKVREARAGTRVILDRLEAMGVNAVRLWDAFIDADYTPGDGSRADACDHFIAEAKRRGFRIWTAGFNRVGSVRPADVDVVDDPATRAAWMEAVGSEVTERRGWRLSNNPAVFWDPRLEALLIDRMTRMATHRNLHTGLRWCDDPVFAVWELSNEQWWVRRMVNGSWRDLPPFFRASLFEAWHGFLRRKYASHAELVAAWGEVKPGEDLDRGTVLFAPIGRSVGTSVALNDAGPFAVAAIRGMADAYDPASFPEARGRDVLEFLVGLHLAHKQRLAAAIKPLGRSTTRSPMIYDTGIGYQVQSQWLHQNADAVAHDAYVAGFGPPIEDLLARRDQAEDPFERKRLTLDAERSSANDGRWIDWLRKPPGIAMGVPWLEHNRVEGKPFLCYETQIQQPAKYRADYPLRLAALASIQDWDWITWHYFGDGGLDRAGTADRPFDQRLDVTTGRHPQGYHFTYDEVQTALMRAAAYAFRHRAWAPAPEPTVFLYGRDSLFDPRSMNYGHSYGDVGLHMLPTTYEHGVRIRIDPERADDRVVGPVVRFEDRNAHNPYTPTDQIVFDHRQGFFKAIAPAAVAFAGRVEAGGELDLGDVRVSDLRVRNARGMYDPIDESRPYLALSVYSVDGRPLSASRHAGVSIASTSFNTGYRMGELSGARVRGVAGDLPVLVARPGATFTIPAFAGGRYAMLDFHGGVVAEGTVNPAGEVALRPDQAVWFIELRR